MDGKDHHHLQSEIKSISARLDKSCSEIKDEFTKMNEKFDGRFDKLDAKLDGCVM
jgi:phage regulator Rha-like protein